MKKNNAHRLPGLTLAASLLLALTSPLSAQTIIAYDADANNPAPSPTDVGFGESSSGSNVTSAAGSETTASGTFNYWKAQTGDSSTLNFSEPITATDLTQTGGWTATAVVRVIQADDAVVSNFIRVQDATHQWNVHLINDGSFSGAKYFDDAAGLTTISSFDLDTDYVTFQMYYDDAADSMDFYLNGTTIGSVARAGVRVDSAPNSFQFGNATTGAVQETNWNQVRLEQGFTVIPEPSHAALGLSMLAAVSVFLRRRNRA